MAMMKAPHVVASPHGIVQVPRSAPEIIADAFARLGETGAPLAKLLIDCDKALRNMNDPTPDALTAKYAKQAEIMAIQDRAQWQDGLTADAIGAAGNAPPLAPQPGYTIKIGENMYGTLVASIEPIQSADDFMTDWLAFQRAEREERAVLHWPGVWPPPNKQRIPT